MNRRRISSSGGKSSRVWPGAKKFTELSDVPGSYLTHAGEIPVVKSTEDGLEFKSSPAIDDHKVQVSATDPAPGYLVAKLEAGIAAAISEDTGTNKAKIDVNLGALSDQAAAGNDARFGKVAMTLSDQSAAHLDPILYGTGDPPDPAGLAEGTLYFKYAATPPPAALSMSVKNAGAFFSVKNWTSGNIKVTVNGTTYTQGIADPPENTLAELFSQMSEDENIDHRVQARNNETYREACFLPYYNLETGEITTPINLSVDISESNATNLIVINPADEDFSTDHADIVNMGPCFYGLAIIKNDSWNNPLYENFRLLVDGAEPFLMTTQTAIVTVGTYSQKTNGNIDVTLIGTKEGGDDVLTKTDFLRPKFVPSFSIKNVTAMISLHTWTAGTLRVTLNGTLYSQPFTVSACQSMTALAAQIAADENVFYSACGCSGDAAGIIIEPTFDFIAGTILTPLNVSVDISETDITGLVVINPHDLDFTFSVCGVPFFNEYGMAQFKNESFNEDYDSFRIMLGAYGYQATTKQTEVLNLSSCEFNESGKIDIALEGKKSGIAFETARTPAINPIGFYY